MRDRRYDDYSDPSQHTDQRSDSDAYLIEMAKQGDQAAYSAIYYKYYRLLGSFFIRFKLRQDDVQDLIQVTFMKIFKHIHAVNNYSSFKSWMYSIASNTLKDHYRANGRRPLPAAAPFDEYIDVVDERLSFEENVHQEMILRMVIEETRPYLSSTQYACLLLHVNSMPSAEIAMRLELKVETVRNYISKAMQLCHRTYQRVQESCNE